MFKNLKSLFVTGDDELLRREAEKKGTTPPPSQAEPAAEKTASPPPPATNINQGTNIDGEVNDKFVNILFGAMEKNNLSGFDYIEFK